VYPCRLQACQIRRLSTSKITDPLFTGTAVTVNFFVEYRGAIAQITLDNAVVPNVVNTFKQGVVDNATCEAISWNSGELSPGNHTVTVTHMASSTYSGAVYLWMRSFVYVPFRLATSRLALIVLHSYTETPAGSGSGNGRTVKKKKSSIPAIAAGSAAGVVALLLLTAAVILLRRRRTKSANSPQKPMLDMDALAAVPFSHPSLGGQDQNAQHPAYQTPPAHEGGPAQGSFSYGNGPPSSDASAYQSYQSGAASPYQSGSAYPGGPVFPSGPAYPDGSSYSGGSAYPGGSAYQSGPAYQGAPLNTQDQRTQHDTSSQSYSSTYSPPSTFFVTNSDTSAAPLNPKQAEHAESNSPNKVCDLPRAHAKDADI
jgi:hypothetical protein